MWIQSSYKKWKHWLGYVTKRSWGEVTPSPPHCQAGCVGAMLYLDLSISGLSECRFSYQTTCSHWGIFMFNPYPMEWGHGTTRVVTDKTWDMWLPPLNCGMEENQFLYRTLLYFLSEGNRFRADHTVNFTHCISFVPNAGNMLNSPCWCWNTELNAEKVHCRVRNQES